MDSPSQSVFINSMTKRDQNKFSLENGSIEPQVFRQHSRFFRACHSQKGLFSCHFRSFRRTHVNLIFSVDKTVTNSNRMFMF